MKLIELTGQRFGRLLVLGKASVRGNDAYWDCACDCGVTRALRTDLLRRGRAVSCGCGKVRHGLHAHPLYMTWWNMVRRCFNPKAKDYRNYGGRGITVCERWLVVEAFIADMGASYVPGHTLDRRDNEGNYEPGNCRWATGSEQAKNRRPRRRSADGRWAS